MKRWRFRLALLLGALLLPWAALIVAACFMQLPSGLGGAEARSTVMVLDRDGRLLREVTVGAGPRVNPIGLREVSAAVVPALLAAEDARFYHHPGIDPLAMARAVGQAVWQRRVVSGASTITQQLARNLIERPRTLRGKLREMALALRLEASLSKSQILEEYLSRVEFGPGLVGIQAASQHYFGKPAAALDLAEAAALVSVPRGPSLYDPQKRPQLVERRRQRVLTRLAAAQAWPAESIERARLTPLHIDAKQIVRGAEHLAFTLARRYASAAGERTRVLTTTLDAGLQREAERIAASSLPSLQAHGGDAISLLVLDNESAEVLAYVGSPDYFDAQREGANDGVLALRQPGSALKPFLYAAAIEQLGYGPATLLPDLPRDFQVPGGSFSPRNYDQRYRGPVLLRQALASSLNLPALEVASRLGPPRLLATLRRFGFDSLTHDAEHYGVGLALGDGEVTLLELVSAYSTLARDGSYAPPRVVQARSGQAGTVAISHPPGRRALAPEVAALVTDMLSDDAARSAGFGRDSVLNLPFPVAAKTGTSKGYRDNWAVGYTREVTVGVWVGNFDGTPLQNASGITAAGPAFHQLMLAAMQGRRPAVLLDSTRLESAEVCVLSGKRPGPACEHHRTERFLRGRVPAETCDLHVLAHVDAQGREQAAHCGGTQQRLERYPLEFRTWAQQAGRPLAGAHVSTTCPPDSNADAQALRVTFPRSGQTFALDPDGPRRQEIVLSADSAAQRGHFVVDGQRLPELQAPFRQTWSLAPGTHQLAFEAGGTTSVAVTFSVLALPREE